MNQPPAESKSAGWEQTAGGHICRTRPASVKLSEASSTSITIVVYLEYNKVIEIDKDGGVSSFIE